MHVTSPVRPRTKPRASQNGGNRGRFGWLLRLNDFDDLMASRGKTTNDAIGDYLGVTGATISRIRNDLANIGADLLAGLHAQGINPVDVADVITRDKTTAGRR